ncbi:lysozyme protein (macronuclear) [Tetrahymena thermophila SB210]|uniref:Lysozyme protein n=1 Tax=Tetrahymena thermophila (strain SB210) TaxID=312017 RepID=Q23YF6_TETTS|nr:lysozyme protein [Tetrahymena thermophila SB210]EAS01577.2 lysozyme protein [Tetrahymena thermophila SB210]|eukprot:XP_001021822.2 lysozyme protein [Tetrahymena thermophila SB210]
MTKLEDVDQFESIDKYICYSNQQFSFQNIVYKQIWGYDISHKFGRQYAARTGMKSNSMYIPCINDNPTKFPFYTLENQTKNLINFAASYYDNRDYGDFFWIVVEANNIKDCQWTNDYQKNCEILTDLVHTASKASIGLSVGIYSSQEDWIKLFGDSQQCTSNKSYATRVHYKSYNSQPNFDDWAEKSFGGWAKPHMKTYQNTYVCGSSIDLSVY